MDAYTSAVRDDNQHSEAAHNHLWWSGEVPDEESKCHSSCQKGLEAGPKEVLASQPHSKTWESGGTVHSGGHPYPHEWQEGDWGSQHGFIKGKSRWTNRIAFCDERAAWTDKETAVDIV